MSEGSTQKVIVKRLTIGEVQECMERTVGQPVSSCEHMVYGIPPAFLKASIADYELLEYEQLPGAVKEFGTVNPTVLKDITKVVTERTMMPDVDD